MTDQTQRLEIATVKAEIGSNILFRFSNDAIGESGIPTTSGDIKNLKQVIADIRADGAEKISFATKIYPTTAAGIAATVDGEIFLVAASDADEIYSVWQNTSGVAVDTGKRAVSASAVIAATNAAQASADEAQQAAADATAKVAPLLSPSTSDPAARADGSALQPGDTYFNTLIQATKVYSTSGWVAANVTGTDLVEAINTREPSIPSGSAGQYWAGDKTFKALDKSAVGLSSVDNTSDASKPVSTAQQTALDDKQGLSANLTAFSGLLGIADKIAYFTASGAMALAAFTAQARTFLAATSQAAQRTALALGNAAVRDSRALLSEKSPSGTPTTWDDGVVWGYEVGTSALTGNGNKLNYYRLTINDDRGSQAVGVNGADGSKVNGLHILHVFGGAQARGGRHALEGTLLQGYGGPGATASDNADRNYVGVQGASYTDSGDGGTGIYDARGAYFGSSSAAGIRGTAKFTSNVTAHEFNTFVEAGTGDTAGVRTRMHTGVQIASFIGERGYGLDAAISVSNLGSSPKAWQYGMYFGSQNAGPALASDSTLIKLETAASATATIDRMIDIRGITTNYLLSANFTSLTDGALDLNKAGAVIGLGSPSVASTPYINFRSSGNSAPSYDTRITSIGGTTSTGGGLLSLDAAQVITQTIRPVGDNAYSCGTAGQRWNVIYSSTGTISTSDIREKNILGALSHGLEFVKSLKPTVYEWKSGETVAVLEEDGFEEVKIPKIEEYYEDVDSFEIVEGKATRKTSKVKKERQVYEDVQLHNEMGEPLFNDVPVFQGYEHSIGDDGELLFDDDGAPVLKERFDISSMPCMVSVPVLETVKVPVSKTVYEHQKGTRPHWGLLAQQVKEVLESFGIDDFAGWTLENPEDPDSRQGLRYEQFIPVLINAIKEISDRIDKLEVDK